MLYTIGNDSLRVVVNSFGAEIQSIMNISSNTEVLWQADEKYWARHAPVLFPIIGRLKNDELNANNQTYSISQHGFARDSEFNLESHSDTSITFSLNSSLATLEKFPYDFILSIEYSLGDAGLSCNFTVINPSDNILPFSLGGHPAFNWPLLSGIPKEQHRITFNKIESGEISLLNDGLICRDDLPSPVEGNTLNLSESLFENDALIFKNVKSNILRYEAMQDNEVSACIEVRFDDFNDLGIWTKPGADFICLEPWLGYSSAKDFDGVFDKKAGLIHLKPGSEQRFSFTVAVEINQKTD